MSGPSSTAVRMRTVALYSKTRDAVSLRLRAETQLAALDCHPRGLARSAILCVRRLQDPRPGSLRFDGRSVALPGAWASAVTVALENLLRGAARPAREPVGDHAGAVLFADRSELLACFAQDALRGQVGARWWWFSLLAQPLAAGAVARAWQQSPEYVPAALELLARRSAAPSVVASWTAPELQAVAAGVARAFALPLLVEAVRAAESLEAAGAAGAGPALDLEQPRREPDVAPARTLTAAPPWESLVGESRDLALSAPQRVFVGLVLLLARAPRVVRSQSFALAAKRTLGQAELRPRVRSQVLSTAVATLADSPLAAELLPSVAAPTPSPGGPELVPASPSARVEPAQPHAVPRAAAAPQLRRDEARSLVAFEASSENLAPRRAPAPLPPEPVAERPLSRVIQTELGGLFFLVGVGQALGLYADFAQPDGANLALSIWDFITLLGECLAPERARSDPIWALLAELAGRSPGLEAGWDFVPDPDAGWPQSWLAPFQKAGPRGRALLDALEVELGAASARLPPARGWALGLLPYVRARLALALNVPPVETGELLCTLPARITVTPTHLDVEISLASLPIELRLAGLDRDPGWVPAAGKYLAFHFTEAFAARED